MDLCQLLQSHLVRIGIQGRSRTRESLGIDSEPCFRRTRHAASTLRDLKATTLEKGPRFVRWVTEHVRRA